MENTFSFRMIDNVESIYNDNTDVEITVNGSKYIATFFTIENIKSLMEKYKSTGECLGGTYFWAADMIIVKDLSESTIHSTLDCMIKNGELEKSSQKISQGR